jgi:ubiquinone/menaquinone biosynthesis C-methylase UbiE
MDEEKRNFDQLAAAWDKQPGRVALAKDVARAIADEVTLTPNMDVLDFGCGTGLLTLELQPYVRSLTGIDSSPGMLGILQAKIQDQNLKNVKTCYLDIESGGTLEGSYDLIVSGMTLHHVREIGSLLNQFHQILAVSGKLCIADLDLDAGEFHDNKKGVFHHGFDRVQLRQMVKDAQFRDIRFRTAARITKPVRDGGEKEFSIFLLTCNR